MCIVNIFVSRNTFFRWFMQLRNCACGDLQRRVYYANVNTSVKKISFRWMCFFIYVHPLFEILTHLNISGKKIYPHLIFFSRWMLIMATRCATAVSQNICNKRYIYVMLVAIIFIVKNNFFFDKNDDIWIFK